MKTIFILILSISALNLCAQWSDTNNNFFDSLHIAVSTQSGSQKNSIVIKSYPDSGYIIFWEDQRTPANNIDIYAQKYDKNGLALWAANGIPVASGIGLEQIAPSSNADYRNYSHAVSDSAGGFFIGYQETAQLGSYNRAGIAVQHIDANGQAMYPGAGLIIRQPLIAGSDDFGMPQIVADGKKGFYISFTTIYSGYAYRVTIEGYKITGNSLSQYVSQIMNEGTHQKSNIGICGFAVLTLETYPLATVFDYHLWPDTQGGCNIVMNMSASDGSTNMPAQRVLAFNALKRIKKDCTTTVFRRTNDIANEETVITNYPKDSVIRLYSLQTFFWIYSCSAGGYTNYQLENFGLGYYIIASGYFDAYYVKGITASAPGGNINVNAIAVSQREYINNNLTPFITKMYTWPDEIFDSIPYQRASSTQSYRAYNILPPASMNLVTHIYDTVLNTAVGYHDFSMAASGNKIFLTARLPQPSGEGAIYLQQLEVNRATANSFGINYNTPGKTGVLIGKERYTGYQGTSISYDGPMVSCDDAGNALFFIREYYRAIRVSPIINGTELSWGAMGKPLGAGIYNNGLYTTDRAFATINKNGTGLICWDDQKYLNNNSGDNIFMRHLDNLGQSNYLPPIKPIKTLIYGSNLALPVVLLGTSNTWSDIDCNLPSLGASTPVVEILDNYNLGAVDVFVYENTTTIRTYNGKPYLDRNYTINPEKNPGGAANVKVRLFFTTSEFDALKVADPTIIDPSSLVVAKQPSSGGNNAPSFYTPMAGESIIVPSAWQAVAGGYYLEITVNSFSNFFIENNTGALPVTWLGIQANRINNNEAVVSWQVADQKNIKNYTIQYSTDGSNFKNGCVINATSITSFTCVVPAEKNLKNYYRVMQQDIDGKISYSKVVFLSTSPGTMVSLYPNPVKDKLYIKSQYKFSEAKITDVNGKFISNNYFNISEQLIDVSHLSSGIYFLKLTFTNVVKTIKFIKE